MAAETPLADLCESIVDCPHSTPVWTKSGVIVLRNQNIRNGRLDLSEPSYTDEAHFVDRTRRALPMDGDLVITREAPMGEVCMIPPGLRSCLGQRMVLLRPNRQLVEPRYLLYALQSKAVQREIGVNEGSGSTVSNLRIPLLKALKIPTRPLAEQRAIAHILGTLDDKIELNRQMNETLEAIARALFKSWFVDFDPVRAKAEGRDPGLPKPIADLFPYRFEPSELGDVPSGWPVGSISDLATLSRAQVKPQDFPEEEFDHYSIPAFDDGRRPARELGAGIKSSKFVVPPECVLISKLNPRTPRVWLPAPGAQRRAIGSTEFLVAIPKELTSSREFLYALFSSDAFHTKFATLVTGTSGSHQRVRPEGLLDARVMLPPPELVEAFTLQAAPLLARVAIATSESATLAGFRDALLPRLISGDLRVRQPEQLVAT